MRELTIAGRRIADEEPAYVIAEVGGNHGGDPTTLCDLVMAVYEADADAVKFQCRDNRRLYTSALYAKPYDNENSYGQTYGAHREHLEFSAAYLSKLVRGFERDCDFDLPWFATAFDEVSANELHAAGVPAFKIHSGGLTDEPLLRHVAAFGKPVLLSTGGGTLDDIDRAHDILGGCPHAILHCVASYPLRAEDANLRMILTLRNRYPDTVIGYSCHSPGIAFSLIAYAFGARIIEKHFTLNRASKGTDHAFSLEPKGLQTLVDDLSKLRVALGDGVKRFLPCEVAPIAKMRRVQTEEGWKIAG
jgi:sialic acid synthase